MKAAIIILLIVATGYGVYYFLNDNEPAKMVKSGENIIITRGDVKVVFKELEKISAAYRVFGINNDFDSKTMSRISSFLYALPLEQAREIWQQDNCESRAASSAENIPIIILDNKITKQLEDYKEFSKNTEHFSLNLKGSMLLQQKLFYKEKELFSRGSNPFEKCLLIEEVSSVKW